MKKKWVPPKVKEVPVVEDSTSTGCQGKRIGCYAGSSCGSVEKARPAQQEPPKR